MAGMRARDDRRLRGKSTQILGQDEAAGGRLSTGDLSNAELLRLAVMGRLGGEPVTKASVASTRRQSTTELTPAGARSEPTLIARRRGRPKGSRLIPDVPYGIAEYRRIRQELDHSPSPTEFCAGFRPPKQRVPNKRGSDSHLGMPIASDTGYGISPKTLNHFFDVAGLTWKRFVAIANRRH